MTGWIVFAVWVVFIAVSLWQGFVMVLEEES